MVPKTIAGCITILVTKLSGAYRSWTTSSRSNAVDAAGNEMMDAGVIHIASAGNNNQELVSVQTTIMS